jgi:predicted membrane protein
VVVDPERRPLMTANIGTADRIVRYLLVLVIIVLLLTKRVHGALAVVLGIIGALLLITAFTRFCALYPLLKISTVKKPK